MLMAVSVGGMFVPVTSAWYPLLHNVMLYGGLVLFTLYIAYDTQARRSADGSPDSSADRSAHSSAHRSADRSQTDLQTDPQIDPQMDPQIDQQIDPQVDRETFDQGHASFRVQGPPHFRVFCLTLWSAACAAGVAWWAADPSP